MFVLGFSMIPVFGSETILLWPMAAGRCLCVALAIKPNASEIDMLCKRFYLYFICFFFFIRMRYIWCHVNVCANAFLKLI